MPPTYPTDLDDPDKLLAVIGSYWTDSYEGSALVRSLAGARGQVDKQTLLNLMELVASVSRFNVPVFHVDNWHLLTIKLSEVNQSPFNHPKFGDGHTFGDGILFGEPESGGSFYAWATDVTAAKVVMNRITHSSLTMIDGLDFRIIDGSIVFRENPFANELVATRPVFEDNEVVDTEAALWVYRGEFDLEHIYNQFGYAINVKASSSTGYRDLVNAIFDSLVLGTSELSVVRTWAALTGVPVVKSDGEVVERIINSDDRKLVVTDKEVYAFHKDAEITIAVGQDLQAGDTMTTTMTFACYGCGDFTRMQALMVPRSMMLGYFGGITFENRTVPLVVEENVDGYTKVSFEISGFPGDVEKFWDDVHMNGIARGKTLAHLMDSRPDAVTEPTAVALPATINPLVFLLNQTLRYNAYVVTLRPRTFGAGRLDVSRHTIMRKIVPPQTLGITVTEWEPDGESIDPTSAPGETTPGCEESVTLNRCLPYNAESVSTADVTDNVIFRRVKGKCQ